MNKMLLIVLFFTVFTSGCVSVDYIVNVEKNEGKRVLTSNEVYNNFVKNNNTEFSDFLEKEHKKGNIEGNYMDYLTKQGIFIFEGCYNALAKYIGYISLIFFFIGASIYILFKYKNKKLQKWGLWIGLGFPILFIIVIYAKPMIEGLVS